MRIFTLLALTDPSHYLLQDPHPCQRLLGLDRELVCAYGVAYGLVSIPVRQQPVLHSRGGARQTTFTTVNEIRSCFVAPHLPAASNARHCNCSRSQGS